MLNVESSWPSLSKNAAKLRSSTLAPDHRLVPLASRSRPSRCARRTDRTRTSARRRRPTFAPRMFRATALPHLHRVVEVLHAHRPEHGMVVTRDVADRPHAIGRRAERRVHRDPVVDQHAARLGDVGRPARPRRPTTAKSPSIRLPSFVTERLEPPVALEPLGRVTEEHLHTVVAVQGLDRAAELGAEHPLERAVAANSTTVTSRPQLPERGGDLGADEPHADEHGLASILGRRADRVAVGREPQVRGRPAGRGPAIGTVAVPRPGRDHGVVERDAVTALELDHAIRDVHALGAHTEARVDRRSPRTTRVGRTNWWSRLAAQVLLRERRALVRRHRLGADQDELAVVALVPERRRRR